MSHGLNLKWMGESANENVARAQKRFALHNSGYLHSFGWLLADKPDDLAET
jgi:hypothetical protein